MCSSDLDEISLTSDFKVTTNNYEKIFKQLLFFRDPINAKPSEPNEMTLLRLCDVHNIPMATNIATAEVLIHGLERGDLDWRDIVHPQN